MDRKPMILLTPGPTPLPLQVREALARQIMPHRSEAFEAILADCSQRLSRVFRTPDPVLTIAGSGTMAFEAAQRSLTKPGDTVVACVCGKFSHRWRQVFDRVAAQVELNVVTVEAPWGSPISPEALEKTLTEHPETSLVTLAHCETSTATVTDLRVLAKVTRARAPDALLIVDAISSVAALPLETQAWGLDVVVSGSQKALMLPPGLGFVSVGPRARERLDSIGASQSLAPLSLDLRDALAAYERGSTPFTPAINLIVALQASLELIERGGVEQAWSKTAALAGATREAMRAMGLKLASAAPADSVTAVFYPPGVGDELRQACAENHNVLLAGGQDDWKGKVFRMSHMGCVTSQQTTAGVEAIAAELRRVGPIKGVDPDAGVAMIRDRLGVTLAG